MLVNCVAVKSESLQRHWAIGVNRNLADFCCFKKFTQSNQDNFGAVYSKCWNQNRTASIDGGVDNRGKIIGDWCVFAVTVGRLGNNGIKLTFGESPWSFQQRVIWAPKIPGEEHALSKEFNLDE